MKHLKLFFALFAMLALGVGNAWGEEVTETITMKNFGGLTTGSLIYQTKPGLSDKGTGMVAFAFTPSTGQVRGNKTGIVGASVTTDQKSHNWSLYNSDPMAGVIKAIKVTQTATGTNKFQNNLYVSLGTSSQGEVTAVTNAQKQDAGGTAQEINFTIDPSKGYTYFKLLSNEQFTSGTVAGVIVTVTYETAGGGETPDPEPDPTTYTIKWHTAKGVTTDVTLNAGATITKPANDPTMTGYAFRGWTEDCEVASDGAGFTAIENFGTATEDKDYYAVFAEATTTSGGGSTEYTLVNTISEGTYLIAVDKVNSSKYNFATGTASNGHAAVETTGVTKSNTISSVPSNAKEYILTGDNTNGYSIKCDDKYLVATAAKQSLSYSTTCSETWTFKVSESGFHLTGKTNGSKMSSNSTTAATSIRNYASSGSFYSPLYFFKKSSGSTTTTYDNYITTCASGVEYVELGDAFKWSAASAEVKIDATDNVFPTLTNTHNVPVTYSSSDETIASIASDGTVTLNKEGSVTITAKYEGGTSAGTDKEYKAKTVTYSLKVNKADPKPSGTTYVKVTSTEGLTDGEYLIVYEAGNVAFNGSLTTLEAVSNTIEVEIKDGKIAGTDYIDAATFTIATIEEGFSIKSKTGYYVGNTTSENKLSTSNTKALKNEITFSGGNPTIKAKDNATATYLKFNKSSDQTRFRYYKSGQEAIALYKKASKHTVTIADCTNGSVSAKMGETSLATNDQVLSGTQITLGNEAKTDYKLAAYDVYKTGEESTKVTVIDGKFIMPEFDVTISATFEAAKTLNSIEITTPATQTTFWQGETFNSTGLKVTAHFEGAEDEDVTSKITVTGSTATEGTQTVTVSFKEGEVTKTTTYNITVKAIPNTKETAYTVADAFDIIDKLGDTDKMYITGFVSQADLEQSSIDQYKNADYWISADGTTNGQQLEAFRGKYLDNTDFTSVNQIMVGDEVIIYGKLTKYGSTYEFAAGNYLVSLKRDKQQPELSYTTTEYNVNLGEAFTAPTLNNTHNLTVTYSSNNEDVATVAADGAVTIKAAGTVTITASFAGNDDYVAGSASYTINITDPSISEATFVAGTDKSDELTITKTPISLTLSNGTLSRDDHYRIFANANATLSAAEGYIITKVVLTSTASGDSQYGPGLLSTEEGTYTYSGKEGTWVGEAYSVTLTASAQTRATKITVYYKQDNRVDAGIAWNPATISLTVGDTFTAPTFTNLNNVTGIEFTSSNDALATVSNAGVITLKDGVAGKATITALFKGNENYKPAKVTCTITVDHKSEDVVILAKCKDQYYALVAEYVTDKTDVLNALPVEYVGGKIYNVETEDQASIIWKRVVVDGKTTFKNGDNYLSAVNSAALKLEEEACDWIFENDMYKIEGADRTILYYATTGGFKNYSINNMSNNGVNGEYSSAAITVAPVFADGDAYHRTVTSGNYGTMCIPYGTSNYSGAKFYEVSWLETGNALWLDEVNGKLVAGKPYIFLATEPEIAIIGDGTTADAPVAGVNGLTGTFTDIAAGGVTNNYIIAQNCIWVANDNNYVNAYRAYIKADKLPTTEQAQLPGRRRVCMGENVETGLDQIVAPEGQTVKAIVNGQLIIIRDGVKYNVQGQKL